MADTGDVNQPAIRHCREHRRITPDDKVPMPDVRHAQRQLVAFPLEVEVERRPIQTPSETAKVRVRIHSKKDWMPMLTSEARRGPRCLLGRRAAGIAFPGRAARCSEVSRDLPENCR